MKIRVNDCDLFIDVEGSGYAYVDGKMEDRPTLMLLHGGPGYSHLSWKPWFSRFADVAQDLARAVEHDLVAGSLPLLLDVVDLRVAPFENFDALARALRHCLIRTGENRGGSLGLTQFLL